MDQRFNEAVQRFDEANSADPNRVEFDGREWAKELLYAKRMTGWLARLAPEASEALRLAAHKLPCRTQFVERGVVHER